MPLVEISQEEIDRRMKEALNKAYNTIYRKLYNKAYYDSKKNRNHKETLVKDVINNRNESDDHNKDQKHGMTIERKTVILKFT